MLLDREHYHWPRMMAFARFLIENGVISETYNHLPTLGEFGVRRSDGSVFHIVPWLEVKASRTSLEDYPRVLALCQSGTYGQNTRDLFVALLELDVKWSG